MSKKKDKDKKAKKVKVKEAFDFTSLPAEKLKAIAFRQLTGREDKWIKKLLKKHPEAVHWRNEAGNTLLMEAFNWSSDEGFERKLIKAGSDVNAVNNAGDTALHIAFKAPTQQGVYRLLALWGAEAWRANEAGETPRSLFDKSAWHETVAGALIDHALQKDEQKRHQELINTVHGGLASSVKSSARLVLQPRKKQP